MCPPYSVPGRSPCGERGLKFLSSVRARHGWRGRSPCGERGLKLRKKQQVDEGKMSLPVRGAWVEINYIRHDVYKALSLPVRGAWVEMSEAISKSVAICVAPRAGSVG